MRKTKRNKRAWIVMLCIAIILIIAKLIMDTPFYQIQKIHWYGKTHDTISLGEVIDFDWDVAYLDGSHYGAGEHLKEKYNLEFSIKYKEREDIKLLLFFQNNELVKVFTLDLDICFPPLYFDRFYPDTVFNAEWYEPDLDARDVLPDGSPVELFIVRMRLKLLSLFDNRLDLIVKDIRGIHKADAKIKKYGIAEIKNCYKVANRNPQICSSFLKADAM